MGVGEFEEERELMKCYKMMARAGGRQQQEALRCPVVVRAEEWGEGAVNGDKKTHVCIQPSWDCSIQQFHGMTTEALDGARDSYNLHRIQLMKCFRQQLECTT